MDPITIAIIAAVSALTVAVAMVVLLKWDDIIKWFEQRSRIKEADKDNIAFTLKERLKSGNYKVVQGIFNKRTDSVVDGKIVEAQQLEKKLAQTHQGQDVVLYE